MRHIREDRREVQVKRSEESARTYYAGLMACGSVWNCPVCAPKIQAIRSAEVRAAIEAWDGDVVLLTQTVPHSFRDELEPLLGAFTESLRHFKGARGYRTAQKRLGIAGSIRGLEVTDGANGWHPHAHTILFLNGRSVSRKSIHRELFKLWESATARAGFGELSPKAFDVQDAKHVKTYITKMGTEYQWGPEHELVRAHSKTGKGNSYTPFDLLRAYAAEPDDGRLLARFAEYATAFHGRRQLVWSDGLKKRLLGTDGLTDQQVADSIGKNDPVLAYITLAEWKTIRRYDLQGQVLQIVSEFGRSGLDHLLDHYTQTGAAPPPDPPPRPESGAAPATRLSTPAFWVDGQRHPPGVAHDWMNRVHEPGEVSTGFAKFPRPAQWRTCL
jgi:hypothetical protein